MTDFMNYKETSEHAIEFLPPLLQWRRGDLSNPNLTLKNGGWQAPVAQWPNLPGQPIDVVHSRGVVVASHLFDVLNIAVLTYKIQWFIEDNDRITWLPPREFRVGAKSRLQVWALIKEFNNAPALITVKSLNAKHLKETIQNHVQNVIAPASRLAENSFARFHFWLPIQSAGKIDAGHEYVTPPSCPLTVFNKKVFSQLFVGPDVAKIAEAEMLHAKPWAETFFSSEAEADEEIEPMDFQETEEDFGLTEDQIPF